MPLPLRYKILAHRAKRAVEPAIDKVVGFTALGLMRFMRLMPVDASSDFCGRFMRFVGPHVGVSRVGRENLKAAFPEKTDAEIETILKGVWENLGRVGGEFVHLDRIWDYDHESYLRGEQGRILTDDAYRFGDLRDDGKPALFFAGHLANWELPAVGSAAHGLDTTSVFRAPNNKVLADVILKMRASTMNKLLPTSPSAIYTMSRILEEGAHLGMLVDQHNRRGDCFVTFFGRRCPVNPTVARLARHFDCPVHGVRAIRLGNGRFRCELTPALDLPRDAEGRIDVDGAMQAITDVLEGWIREYPEQWLWLHRRWRPGDAALEEKAKVRRAKAAAPQA